MDTVEENWFFYTMTSRKSQITRALYCALGAPSLDDLKAIMNLIKNNSVTLAAKEFGLDVATIKGKTTRTNPATAVSILVEIPDELLETQQDVAISMDGLTVNSLMFRSIVNQSSTMTDNTITDNTMTDNTMTNNTMTDNTMNTMTDNTIK